MHIAYGVEPAPGMERLSLLEVDWYRMVHKLHFFLSVAVGRYSTEIKLLAFSGKLPPEGLPPVTDLPVAYLAVRRAVCAVPREYHLVHVKGNPPSCRQTMPYDMARKNTNRKY